MTTKATVRVSDFPNPYLTLKVEMDLQQARFLMGLVQNSMRTCPEDEPEHEAALRHEIFKALQFHVLER